MSMIGVLVITIGIQREYFLEYSEVERFKAVCSDQLEVQVVLLRELPEEHLLSHHLHVLQLVRVGRLGTKDASVT